MMPKTFNGKTALVTGGTRGIGKAIATTLAERGCDVAVNFLKSRAAADATVAELTALGVRALPLRANVGNIDHLGRMFDRIKDAWGHLDIFVNNAALGPLKPVLELDNDDWQRSMEINARALLFGAQRAAALMKGRKGKIVSITSMGADHVLPDYGAVGAAKAALESLTRYLAVELAPLGINANCVAGGVVDTESLKPFPKREEMLSMALAKTPAGRLGEPIDIARVVAFLCSDDSDWIRGQTIVADGGYSLWG
ncbi:MAG: SDR family oxidoreductase [Acidobacteriota bacterium]